MPSDLCSPDGLSPLSDLFLYNNNLTGNLNVSNCLNLILLDASFNNLDGALLVPQGYNHLHTVNINNNEFDMTATLNGLIAGRHVTDIGIANNFYAADASNYSSHSGQFVL